MGKGRIGVTIYNVVRVLIMYIDFWLAFLRHYDVFRWFGGRYNDSSEHPRDFSTYNHLM